MKLTDEILIEGMKKILLMPTKYEIERRKQELEEQELVKQGWVVVSSVSVPPYFRS